MNEVVPIRILIADDHPSVLEGIVALINRAGGMVVVGKAANGQEAVDLFRLHKPDVLLIDLSMPVMDGLTAIRAIRAEFPQARILILTIYEGDEDIHQGIEAGASAYLFKAASCAELTQAIRAVHAGQRCLPAEVATKLVARLQRPELTKRELEVLNFIVKGNSNKETGNLLFIAEGTVKAHVNSILEKMQVSDRTQATVAALQRGLVHIE